MTSQLDVPSSPEQTLRRQPSATRITVSTVRPVAPEPVISVDTSSSSLPPDSKDATISVPDSSAASKQPKRKSKLLRARRRGFASRTLSEGEEEDESDVPSGRVVREDDDTDDDTSSLDGSTVSSDDEHVEQTAPPVVTADGDATKGPTSSQPAKEQLDASSASSAPLESATGGDVPAPAALPGPNSSDATPSTGSKLSWAAMTEDDDDDNDAALEQELAAEVAAAAAAKKARAASEKKKTADANAAAAVQAAKERKKLKDKERKLRKKAELAASAESAEPASKKVEPKGAAKVKTAPKERVPPTSGAAVSKDVQEERRERKASPTASRAGSFWGHDERNADGNTRKASESWRGRGGRGGGRGGFGNVVGRSEQDDAPVSRSERVPPHIRGDVPSARGGAGFATRGGRGGGRGGAFAARALGSIGASPAPTRSKLRGWDDEEDEVDDLAGGVPKVDYDALEGKAVRQPPRAARPPPQTNWTHDPAPRDKQRDATTAPAVRGAGQTLSGVPTAPRAMLKAAAEAASAGAQDKKVAKAPTPPKEAPQPSTSVAKQAADSKWAHDGFAELQQREGARVTKKGARGGLAGAVGRGGATGAGKGTHRDEKASASKLTAAETASPPVQRVTSPAGSGSPHRAGVPLDGKGGVYVPRSTSRSNSVAGRDSSVVFGSVHGSADGDRERVTPSDAAAGPSKQAQGRPAAPQQVPSSASLNSASGSQAVPAPAGVHHLPPGQASSVHSAASGTPPPYPMAQAMPVSMANALPPGFAVDSTGMVFNVTGGQPVAVGYLPPMPSVAAPPMGAYFPGQAYGEDQYGSNSPAHGAYSPAPYGGAQQEAATAYGAQTYQSAPAHYGRAASSTEGRVSPSQTKQEATTRALPPHMQQPNPTTRSSVLGKHARTISTLPASAATVPAFRPSGSPAPSSGTPGSDVPRYVPQPSFERAYHAGGDQGQGHALLEHAMLQVQLGPSSGARGERGGVTSAYEGMDAYAAQISPPMGTVYFQPAPGGAGVGGADLYGGGGGGGAALAAQGYGSPAYYGGAGGGDMYDSDPSFFAAAYEHPS